MDRAQLNRGGGGKTLGGGVGKKWSNRALPKDGSLRPFG